LENVSNALSEDVAQKLAQITRNLPFQKEMKGAMRQKAMGREHETVRMKQVKDEEEFECYRESFLSSNFKLPFRKLCPNAFVSAPGLADTYVMTEIIESPKEEEKKKEEIKLKADSFFKRKAEEEGKDEEEVELPGQDLSHHFQVEGESKKIIFQVVVTHLPRCHWSLTSLTPRFVYNSFDSSEKIT